MFCQVFFTLFEQKKEHYRLDAIVIQQFVAQRNI